MTEAAFKRILAEMHLPRGKAAMLVRGFRAARALTEAEDDARRQLGLSREAVSVEAVHRSYRRLATVAHPDAGGSADAFHRLTMARDLVLGTIQRTGRSRGKAGA